MTTENYSLRRLTFTLFNYQETDINRLKGWMEENCKYGIFGEEICPNTGRKHLQGYL